MGPTEEGQDYRGHICQREDKTHRVIRRAQKIRERLDGSASMIDRSRRDPRRCTGVPMSSCSESTTKRKWS